MEEVGGYTSGGKFLPLLVESDGGTPERGKIVVVFE